MPPRNQSKLFIDTIAKLEKCCRRMDYPAGPREEAEARIRLLELCASIAVRHGFALATPGTEIHRLVIDGKSEQVAPRLALYSADREP